MPSVSGFSDTAAYFEARAQRATRPARRAQFAEAAKFYRALARITPTFPHGYQQPAAADPKGSPETVRCRRRAQMCRAMALATRDPNCRAMLLRLAESYAQTAPSAFG